MGANIPLTKFLDVGGSYTYGWFKSNNQNLHSNIVQVDGTAYLSFSGLKPFATAILGHNWDRTTGTNLFIRSDFTTWGGVAGVEIPVEMVTVTPYVGYNDDLRNSHESSQDMDGGIKANYWYNDKWAIFADVRYKDVFHSSFDQLDCSVGLRRRF